MAVTNVTTSDGVYTFNEFGNTYKYYASSRVMYMVTFDDGSPSFLLERRVDSEYEHQQLLDRLTGGSTSNSVLPVISDPAPFYGTSPDLPTMDSPKYVPDPEGMILGRIPQTVRFRVGGIGVVPSINPVIMDKSYKPKKFSFKDMPENPEELQEYVRQVVSQGMGKMLRNPIQPAMGEFVTRR